VVKNIRVAITHSIFPISIINADMILAMTEVGRLFKAGKYYEPEMLVSA
jgi:cobalamin-dependent methionine synthase I